MKSICCILGCLMAVLPMTAQTYSGSYPSKQLSNGILTAKIYLPDAEKGFYRGTRFDWAGVIGSLEYNGHEYYGPFFEQFDPSVSDVVIADSIKAGINSSASGPVEEFVNIPDGPALGYTEAKPGEAFCKIGVGSLRKINDAPYSSYVNYPILDGGQRSQNSGPDWIELTQKLECGSGYAYTYTKTIRFEKNEPVMTIEHRLVNTGKKPIDTQVYDHNFLRIDHQPTGPDVSMRFPFSLVPTSPLKKMGEVRGNQLVFLQELKGHDIFGTHLKGFGNTAADYEITVENHKTGAGVVIRGDQPLTSIEIWAVRTVVAPEPYIAMKIAIGQEFRWKYTYRFYTNSTAK